MNITIGSERPETAVKLKWELGRLLPVLDFSLAGLASKPSPAGLLEQPELSCIVTQARISPAELPAGVDCFPVAASGRVLSGDGENLTVCFRRGDEIWPLIRSLLLPPLIFAGAGIGGVDNVTLGVFNALKDCEVCIYDALIPAGILDFIPAAAEKIFVGKRTGRHYMKQPEINSLLVEYAKSGKKVVRLKGGDPTIFGRLAEEVDTLQRERLAFRVLPGVTSLSVAAASCGLLPTRRGLNRGFTVMTPRRAGSRSFAPLTGEEEKELFKVYYMAAGMVGEITAAMRAEGFAADWPVSLIYNAGEFDETVVCGTIADIGEKIAAGRFRRRPALVLTGAGAAAAYLFEPAAPLAGRKILCLGDRALFPRAQAELANYGGRAVFAGDGNEPGAAVNGDWPPNRAADYDGRLELNRDRLKEDCLRLAAGFVNQKIAARLRERALTGEKRDA